MSERTDGDCFVVAANIIACYGMSLLADESAVEGIKLLKKLGISSDELWLCHGYVTRATDGHRHCHAWLEIGGKSLVMDYSNSHRALLASHTYYKAGGIDFEEVVRYDATQARRKMVHYETYGPWHEIFDTKGETDE